MQEANYIKYALPELLWLASLNEIWGWKIGAKIALEVVRSFTNLSQSQLWYSYTSSIDEVSLDDLKKVIEILSDSTRGQLKNGLLPLCRAYPKFPLNKVLFGENLPAPTKDDIKFVKDLIRKCLQKRETPAVMMQGNSVYCAIICKSLQVVRGAGLDNFNEIEHHPHTEESKGVAASICAIINIQTGFLLDSKKVGWANYFWNRGLELEEIDYSHIYEPKDDI